MERPKTAPITPRAERRAMIALLTAFALLVQALIPSLAVARPLAEPGMTICTEMGLMPAPADDSAPASPSKGCDHCLCPAPLPAALPAALAAPLEAVRYAAALPAPPTRSGPVRPGRGLAAPPPPSRGPPAPNA